MNRLKHKKAEQMFGFFILMIGLHRLKAKSCGEF